MYFLFEAMEANISFLKTRFASLGGADALGDLEVATGSDDRAVSPSYGAFFSLWVALLIALHGVIWLSGFRPVSLGVAVERGAAEVERRNIGEVPEEVIRKAIRIQRQTTPFWTTLAALGDFGVEPLLLVLRALMAATLFAGVAALTGRTIGFQTGLDACAISQGWWVLGLGVRVALMMLLRRSDVETSLALLLPAGPYRAARWLAAQQVDAFILIGWASMTLGAWRRGQTSLFVAFSISFFLWFLEGAVRVLFDLVIGAGMRLTVLPS